MPGGSGPRDLRPSADSRQLVLSQNKGRLDGGLSYLELPPSIAKAARQLLSQVVDAYGQAQPLMQVSPATVAAVTYISARQEGRALSLGTVAGALDVHGPDVFKEFRWVPLDAHHGCRCIRSTGAVALLAATAATQGT